jgi:hypothetical protein
MGFLSKLMKNPMVQMALPFALSAAMPGIGGMFAAGGKLGGLGLGSMFSGMNPMAANALKQSMLGYGTAALTGAKKPGKAALYSGLASIPFSYMSAANAASAFNEANQGLTQPERFLSKEIPKSVYAGPMSTEIKLPPKQVYNFRDVPLNVPKVTPMDILMGNQEKLAKIAPGTLDSYTSDSLNDVVRGEGYTRTKNIVEGGPKFRYSKIIPGKQMELPGADIFTKKTPLQEVYDPKTGTIVTTGGENKMDMLGTLGPLGLGLLGEYTETEEQRNAEEWARNKERRRKELAFMYGVDPSLIEGEMDNPFYTGAFMNSGGIASLNMDMGGNVSGPGGPKDDMIDAKLSDGEFVMTAKAVENFGNGDRYQGARKMYDMMNMLDPESETMSEVV